jgi:hypothetical protein
METYIDIYLNADGELGSTIHKKLIDLGLKPTIGEHDYVFNWKGIVNIEEEMQFIDKVQNTLKGSGAVLKFKTHR